MNKEFLIEKVSKLLGVSASEKDFAFQIFLEKTGDVLEKGEALKYPSLGFFYVKENDSGRDEQTESLVYIPLQKEPSSFEEKFFLSFEIKKKNKNPEDFDPSVFSLSIDKSTLPFEKDSLRAADISYHLLKKTIEERVEDLISSSVHLENFKILDSFFTENNAEEEYVLKDEKENYEISLPPSYEEMIFSRMNLEENKEDTDAAEPEIPEESSVDGFDFDVMRKALKEEEMENSFVLEPEKELEEFTILKEDVQYLSPKKNKDEIDWFWSEEIKEEDEEKEEKKDIAEPLDIKISQEDENISADVIPVVPEEDLFGELEKTLIVEIEPPETNEIKAKNNSITDDSAIQQEIIIVKKEPVMAEEKEDTPIEEENTLQEDENSRKRNILLIGSLAVILLAAIYIIFFNGFGIMSKGGAVPKSKPEQAQNSVPAQKDSVKVTDKTSVSSVPVNTIKPGEKEKALNAKPKTEDKYQKVKESSAGSLLREISNENKVAGNIFTDGSKFYVQVSSWKNLIKAEQETKRLKAKGLDAFIVKAYIEQFKGTWYRVRVGSFKTKEEAETFSRKNL